MTVVLKYLSDEEKRYSINRADFDLKDELANASLREGVRILKKEGFTKEQRRFLLSTKNLETKVYDFTQIDGIEFEGVSYYQGYLRFMQEEGGLSRERAERLWASYKAGILGDTKLTKAETLLGYLTLGFLGTVLATSTFYPLIYFVEKEGYSGLLPGIALMPVGLTIGITASICLAGLFSDDNGDEEREFWFSAKKENLQPSV